MDPVSEGGSAPSAADRLAAELRAGQALRARRSDLDLGPIGGFALGRFTVRGRRRKAGEVVDLHPELGAFVDEVLISGNLSDAERAYEAGEIDDYYLFPVHRLRKGRALVHWCARGSLGEKSIRKMFAELEEVAGVEHRPGRALYGLRRQAADLAPKFDQDSRVLNRLSGHLDSATREQIYQDQHDDPVRARAADARRRMRQHLRDAVGPEPAG